MGYTHYWYTIPQLDSAKFAQFAKDCKKIFEQSEKQGIKLADGSGEKETQPIAQEDLIDFNGLIDGYETCAIEMNNEGRIYTSGKAIGKVFNCCKTANRPYDTTVTAVLIAFKKHFGEDVIISSDGDIENWQAGAELCFSACGYGTEILIDCFA